MLAGLAVPLSGQATAPAEAVETVAGPAFTWQVADTQDVPVGGATVRLYGPASRPAGNVVWSQQYMVRDCTSAPCAENSMDQDPRPGFMMIDRLVTGSTVRKLTSAVTSQRYRIQAVDAPTDHMWQTRDQSVEIPAESESKPTSPAPGAWKNEVFDFGTLRVTQGELFCEADNIYSVSAQGQLQHLALNEGRTEAVVTPVGLPAPKERIAAVNGLGMGADGETVYAYETSEYNPTRILKYNVKEGVWKPTGATAAANIYQAGAVDTEGTYWVGGFMAGGRFRLASFDAQSNRLVQRGLVDVSRWQTEIANGDMAFDGEGNLYIVGGPRGDTKPNLNIYRVDKAEIEKGTGTALLQVSSRLPAAHSPFQATNGIAFDARGALFIGAANRAASVRLPVPEETAIEFAMPGVNLNTTDLASCSYPPTVQVKKNLPDGRLEAGDQFRLEMTNRETSLGTVDTKGAEPGLQPERVGPIPVTSGEIIELAEQGIGTVGPGKYGSNWECVVDDQVVASGTGTSGSFPAPVLARGGDIVCGFTNTIPKVTKSSNPDTGTPVDAGDIVDYTLTFDNSAGRSAVDVDYWDSLVDVLDDAVFVAATGEPTVDGVPAVTVNNGIAFDVQEDWDPVAHSIRARGTIQPGETGTLTYSVRVHDNTTNAAEREQSESPQGYSLRNFFVRGDGSEKPPPLPEECVEGQCTENPVNAWTITKDSVPGDGELVYKGGTVYYRVAADKLNPTTSLDGFTLQDDLTQVFKTAGWAPDAQVAGDALARGLYLFNADGRSIGLDGEPNSDGAERPVPVRDVAAPTQVDISAGGAAADPRWLVNSGDPMDLPAAAVRAEMWFAVQVGESPEGIPAAEIWEDVAAMPATGWRLVNYATGMAAQSPSGVTNDFAPNACATGVDVPDTSLAPGGANPVDEAFPERCRTEQTLSQNSFLIRKDAGGAGVAELASDPAWGDDPTGLTNLTGQRFEVRDSVKGAPTAYPSVRLCRTDYDPTAGWRGQWVAPAEAADERTWDFASGESATQQRILDWNNSHPDEGVPMCGTLAEVTSGDQAGSWRSDGLGSGDYWLVETRAPESQLNPATEAKRPVPGVQLLADAIAFTVWPEADAPTAGESMQGRGQLDVGDATGAFVDRCDPASAVGERPLACVNAAGKYMVVKDASPAQLPLTGGQWLALVTGAGALVLLTTLGVVLWRRRALAHAGHTEL